MTSVLQALTASADRLFLGAAAGLLATLVMDVAMRRLPEGTTPPFVAAGVLSDEPLGSAPALLATAVHYVAGIGSGVLLAGLALAAESLLNLSALPAHVVAAVVQLPVMIAFFSYLVVPVYGRVPADRVDRVRTDWALSAGVYVVALTALAVAPVLIA
jgi:hypothetical protein